MIQFFSVSDLFVFRKTQIPFPFNIEIKLQNIDKGRLIGPGIYLMTYSDKIIYVGKFRLFNRGNVAGQRWIHHLATFTGRGSNVGFGSVKKWIKHKYLYESAFKKAKLYLPNESEYWFKRCKDTGTVTSINRMKFSIEFFNEFNIEAAKLENLDFKFWYVKLPHSEVGEIDKIENHLINEVNAIGNFQYDSSKGTMQLDQVLHMVRNNFNNYL